MDKVEIMQNYGMLEAMSVKRIRELTCDAN